MHQLDENLKVILTGHTGQIGWSIAQLLESQNVTVILPNRSELDLMDADSIRATIRGHTPDLIINAAGYTAVDRAESEPEIAQATNTTALGIIGEEAKQIGAAVIHFSTDYVFDGSKQTPYLPDDKPNPINVYGRTKLDGEHALLDSSAKSIIIRTSWIYGLRRKNFLLAILRQAREGNDLRVVDDQTGCPTWCRVVANAAVEIISTSLSGSTGNRHFDGKEGIYHASCQGEATWFDFAVRAFEVADVPVKPHIQQVTSAEFAAQAKRPAYSVLECRETQQAFGIQLPTWEDALARVFADTSAAMALAEATGGHG